MAETHVLSGLVNKYSELAGELDEMRRQVRTLESDLANIASIIKIFDLNGYMGMQ